MVYQKKPSHIWKKSSKNSLNKILKKYLKITRNKVSLPQATSEKIFKKIVKIKY